MRFRDCDTGCWHGEVSAAARAGASNHGEDAGQWQLPQENEGLRLAQRQTFRLQEGPAPPPFNSIQNTDFSKQGMFSSLNRTELQFCSS